MFTFYQRVCSKKTGLPMTGTIAGIWHPLAYINHCRFQGIEPTKAFKSWNKFYPDWPNKYLYFVYFDTPSKTCSKEEFEESGGDSYDQLVDQVTALYPEDDLELME